MAGVTVLVYLHDHLDGGQRGGDVLRVRRPHRDWHTAGIKAAIKRHDEVDSWEMREEIRGDELEEKGELGERERRIWKT